MYVTDIIGPDRPIWQEHPVRPCVQTMKSEWPFYFFAPSAREGTGGRGREHGNRPLSRQDKEERTKTRQREKERASTLPRCLVNPRRVHGRKRSKILARIYNITSQDGSRPTMYSAPHGKEAPHPPPPRPHAIRPIFRLRGRKK